MYFRTGVMHVCISHQRVMHDFLSFDRRNASLSVSSQVNSICVTILVCEQGLITGEMYMSLHIIQTHLKNM